MALDGRGRRLATGLVSALSSLALTAVPAGAAPATYALEPDGTFSSESWTGTPAATPQWDLLNDGVKVPSPASSAGDHLSRSDKHGQGTASFSLEDLTLADGETITGATLWVYVTTSQQRALSAAVWTPAGEVLGVGTIPSGMSDTWFPVSLTTPTSPSQLDWAVLTLGDEGKHEASYVYAAYVEVNTTGAPVPPPAEDPPAEDPPAEDPPAEDPPAEDPPAEDPPAEDPPAEDPPAEDPPAEDPPAEDPPAEDPPAEDPPAEDPPAEDPPAEDPPAEGPPAEDPPAEDPPVIEDPPAEDPPAEDPPAEDPPATDPPPSGVGPGIARAMDVVGTQINANAKGLVAVSMRCAETETRGCHGYVSLEEPPKAKRGTRSLTAARRGKRIGKPVRFKLTAGQTRDVPVKIDPAAFRTLKRKRSFTAQVVIEKTDSAGHKTTFRRTIRVFPRGRKKR